MMGRNNFWRRILIFKHLHFSVILFHKIKLPYARHYNPLLIRNRSWILTIHKARILRKKPLEKAFLDFKKWVKSIQTAGYNGERTVPRADWLYRIEFNFLFTSALKIQILPEPNFAWSMHIYYFAQLKFCSIKICGIWSDIQTQIQLWSLIKIGPTFFLPRNKNIAIISQFKVRTFWETHKIWKNLHHGFDKSADLLKGQLIL